MIRLKTEAEIDILRAGGKRLAAILAKVKEQVKPGIKTRELDELALGLIKAGGDQPAFLGYRPQGARLAYPATLCVSINEAIVHGLPGREVLRAGDVVSLDLGLKHQGFFTDMAITVPVGEISPEAKRMIEAVDLALATGISAAQSGRRVGDISAAIEKSIKQSGFQVVQDLSGHGVGHAVHEEPFVPNFGRAGTGPKLVPGLVLAIEPMLSDGQGSIKLAEDGFTLVTADGCLATHAEQTIVITAKGPEILTV